MISLFVKDGKLTVFAEACLFVIVLLGCFGIPLLEMPVWIAVLIGLLAIISAAILIFEGAAASVGLKPLTNDPLGWRKAKKSYEPENSPDMTPDKDSSS
jgi:hypothetical protein